MPVNSELGTSILHRMDLCIVGVTPTSAYYLKSMKTIKSKQYDKLFPWRKYMIEQNFDKSLSNMRKDMPEKIKKKFLKYLKENGNIGIW